MRFSSPKLLLVLLVVGFPILVYISKGPSPIYCEKSFAERDHKVVMFSTTWCPYCKKARQFFNENQIRYCEYDVNGSAVNEAALVELGGNGVPLILIGDQTLYGFQELPVKQELYAQELFSVSDVN